MRLTKNEVVLSIIFAYGLENVPIWNLPIHSLLGQLICVPSLFTGQNEYLEARKIGSARSEKNKQWPTFKHFFFLRGRQRKFLETRESFAVRKEFIMRTTFNVSTKTENNPMWSVFSGIQRNFILITNGWWKCSKLQSVNCLFTKRAEKVKLSLWKTLTVWLTILILLQMRYTRWSQG